MKVKELIEKLQKCNPEKEVGIRFGLDKDDEIGYWLEIAFVEDVIDTCNIYAEYIATKKDCDFVGQVDLKEAYKLIKESEEK